jgi:hypothetical protein
VSRLGSRDGAVILHSDQEPTIIFTIAVGEADDGLNEFRIGQRLPGLAFELER